MRKQITAAVASAITLMIFASLCLAQADQGKQARPNIVFILIDDLRWDELGCAGHPFIKTPNIDRIAKEGALFRNAFMTTPLCSPSRASFLTGQYAHTHGITDNVDRSDASHQLATFPRLLHQSGYETAFIGKWHMGNDDKPRPGFDRWVSFKGQGAYRDPDINEDGKSVRPSGYITDILNGYAVEFIKRRHDKPFLVYLAHKAIHPEVTQNNDGSVNLADSERFIPAERHEYLYAGQAIPRRPSYGRAPEGKPALQRRIGNLPPLGSATATRDEAILGRQRSLMAIEDGVGEILRALAETGQLDNTVIVFTSDNGYFYGEHGLSVERRLAYEESIRMPLLVRYPKAIKSGAVRDEFVLNIDLAPSLLELAGVAAPGAMQGRSLAPLLRGKRPAWRNSFLIEYYSDKVFPRVLQMGYKAVRSGRWKYIHYLELEGMDELYDLKTDPFELKNLIHQPGAAKALDEMKQEMERLLKETAANPKSEIAGALPAAAGTVQTAQAQTATLAPQQQLARDVFRELIEINTTHRFGSTKAAEAMAARLKTANFPSSDVQVIGPRPDKMNLVARLRGKGQTKPVLFIAHLDVVEARKEDWSPEFDPFKFIERDGYFYGRGTADVKGEAAALIANLIRLKQEGFAPARDIIVALTADEEGGDPNGDANGVDWLLQNRRELIDAAYCINTDAGGGQSEGGKRMRYNVQTSEKAAISFRLEVKNSGGHSSQPIKDNAIYHLAEGLARLAKFDFPVKLNETTRAFFERMSKQQTGQMAEDMKAVARTSPDLVAAARLSAGSPFYNSVMRTTCVATMLEAGHAHNALPQTARAVVNCRVLPVDTQDGVIKTLTEALADSQISITPLGQMVPSPASPLTPEVIRPVERIVAELWPGVPVTPVMDPWATDGLYLRRAGIAVYGAPGIFFDIDPIRAHGKDERIGVQAFYEGVEFMYRLMKATTAGK